MLLSNPFIDVGHVKEYAKALFHFMPQPAVWISSMKLTRMKMDFFTCVTAVRKPLASPCVWLVCLFVSNCKL